MDHSGLFQMQVHDRAQVFVVSPTISTDGSQATVPKAMHIGTLERWSSPLLQLPTAAAVPGLQLEILVTTWNTLGPLRITSWSDFQVQ